jgi:hypothetical protein
MSTIETVDKDIGGRTFRFGKLPADKAYGVFMIVTRNLGAPLMELAGTGKQSGVDVIGAVTSLVFGRLNDNEIRTAMETLFSATSCLAQKPTGRVTWETFNGRLLDAFLVAVESFRVNFADFLAVVPLLSKQGSAPSTPPTPQT